VFGAVASVLVDLETTAVFLQFLGFPLVGFGFFTFSQ
jgi:hypothetical protein